MLSESEERKFIAIMESGLAAAAPEDYAFAQNIVAHCRGLPTACKAAEEAAKADPEKALKILWSMVFAAPLYVDKGKDLSMIARIFENARDYRNAENAFALMDSLMPNDPIILTQMGHFYNRRGNWQKAESCYRQVISLEPDNHIALSCLGRALAKQERFGEAVQCLESALAVKPNDLISKAILAGIYRKARLPQKAYDLLKDLFQGDLRPDDMALRRLWTHILLDLGQFKEARDESEDISTKCGKWDWEHMELLVTSRFLCGDKEAAYQAAKDWSMHKGCDDRRYLAVYLRGLCAIATNRLFETEDCIYHRCLEDREYQKGLLCARLHLAHKNCEKAYAIAAKIFDAHPSWQPLSIMQAAAQGKPELAEDFRRRLCHKDINPSHGLTFEELIAPFSGEKDPDQIRRDMDACLSRKWGAALPPMPQPANEPAMIAGQKQCDVLSAQFVAKAAIPQAGNHR